MGKHSREDGAAVRDDLKPKKKAKKGKVQKLSEPAQLPTPESLDNEPASQDFVYQQSAELSALPQSEIDEFLSTSTIKITDPNSTNLRPITAFSQLPETFRQLDAFKAFKAPTSVQSAAWPFLLSGRDVVGVAETGSGKTIAFALPLLVRLAGLKKKKSSSPRAVIIAPTRELAIQVFEQVKALVALTGIKAVCVYGGVGKDEQRAALKSAAIVVATPGRLKDFMQEGSVSLSKVNYAVLDEADRMLDKGFEQDIKRMFSEMPSSKKRQTAMFTATWPRSIQELAATFMKSPVRINIGDNESSELRANTRIVQTVEVMDRFDKEPRLQQLLNQENRGANSKDKILVFCLYKKEAMRIERLVRSKGFEVGGIHGDMSQRDREQSLSAFKSGQVTILVATDVAARGLDIPAVKLVINVTFPLTAEDYVHRIGRTGRAGASGRAITFFTEDDKQLSGPLINVLKAANQEVPKALLKFGGTVKKKQHDAYGAFFRADDDGKTATKITFDD